MNDKNKSLDFLPESEQKEAKEALSGVGQQKAGDIKLVVPKIATKEKKKEAKKDSWWQRRKKRREEKVLEKKRKRGELGEMAPVKRKEKKAEEEAQAKSDLFSDVINHKPQKSWWEAKKEKKKVVKEAKPAPIKEFKAPPKVASHEISFLPPPPPPKPPKPIEERVVVMPKPLEEPKKEKKKDRKHFGAAKPAPLSKKLHGAKAMEHDFGPRVNLVPEEALSALEGQPIIFGASILIMVVAFWVLVGGVAVSRVKKAEAQVQQKNAELAKVNKIIKDYDSGKAVAQTLQKQFGAVDQLMDTHIYWTPVLQKLEETTIPDVYYSTIDAKKSGEVLLGAIAKNFDAAARQIRAFEKAPQFVSSVLVTNATVQNQPGAKLPVPVVTFDIYLQLVDNILYFQNPEEAEE